MRVQVFVLASALAITGAVFSQTTGKQGPRMPDGHPDLQGTYDIATLTTMERTAGAKPTMTMETARRLETENQQRRARANAPLAVNRTAPPVGGEGRGGGGGGKVGGYNNFWLDPGSRFTVIDGQVRTSLVVDPPDGRIPPYTAEAQKRIASQRARAANSSDAAEGDDPDLDRTPGAYDDPERRPLAERCLLGFGSTSGPPALPDYMYNNLHRIVQTPDNIMILTEMVHDARIVRMNAQHLPPTMRKWLGDPVGHWEGDTLVVDTTNFTDKTRFRGSTANLHVVERFSRLGPKELLYRVTVEDPDTWAHPWTIEQMWPATDAHIFEYACHESNYALGDILRGARERDKDAKRAK
jgi:hypothetical protein